jgi:hypothetical protein
MGVGLKKAIETNLKNLPGWSTKRKLVVIESDDWGSTRMPNKNTFNYLMGKGIKVDKNKFTSLDTLASSADLNILFETLSGIKDQKGNNAVLSPFVNTTNADHEKIIASGYSEYYYEPFTETLKKYYPEDVFSHWNTGIQNNLFAPQYHGREHFNVPLLMKLLREGNKDLIEAFSYGVIHIPINYLKTKSIGGMAPTYYYDTKEDLEYLKGSLVEGAAIFQDIFGFAPRSFGPPNGIFNAELEEALAKTPIQSIVVNRTRIEPAGDGSLNKQGFLYKFGKSNKFNHIYYRRNVKFEPIQKASYSRDTTLFEIGAAFRFGKPAIISSHRINYIGSIETGHRDFAIAELKELLKKIIVKWPDAEFISSAELGRIIKNSQ